LQRELPRMTGLLDRILVSLEAYVAIDAPAAAPPAVRDETTAAQEES